MKTLMNLFLTTFLCLSTFAANAQNGTINTKDLEIKMVADYDWIYNDSGTGASKNLSIWRPKTPTGFYRLGYYAHNSHGEPQAVSIVVKGLTVGALSYPTDYVWRYNDSQTGGEVDVSVWEPVAPPGYRALGTVAIGSYGKPDLKEVVCIKEELVVGTTIGREIWNDAGSGGEVNGGVWYIKPPRIQDDKMAYLTSGSFVCATSHSKPRFSDIAYALEVKMPTSEKKLKPQKPTLISTEEPAETTKSVLTSISYLPCISVNDPSYTNKVTQQIKETPIYTLERWTYYKRHGFSHNKDTEDGKLVANFEVGMETTTEESMEQTFETSATVEAGVESGIYSASISVTMSYAVSHSQSFSTTRSKTTSFGNEYRVPAEGAAALYTLSYEYVLKNGKGRKVDSWTMDSDNNTYFVTYDPNKNKPKVKETTTTTTTNNNHNLSATKGTFFIDNFDDNSARWHIGSSDVYAASINNGKYYLNNKVEKDYVYAHIAKPIDVTRDFMISAKIEHVSGTNRHAFGVTFGQDSDLEFQSLLINVQGQYTVGMKSNNQWKDLKSWASSEYLNQGETASNILSVEKRGNKINFFLNGYSVHSMDYLPFMGNNIGFIAYDKQQIAVESVKISYQ